MVFLILQIVILQIQLKLTVIDLLGKFVLTQKVDSNSLSRLSFENQSKGMYMLKLKSGDFEVTQKLILE